MKRFSVLAAFALVAAHFSAMAGEPAAQTVFDQLKALKGEWRSATGKTVVNYRLIANDSSIIETWTMSPTRQSMTVYTMDGDRIIATHYCPQGNAPRLAFSRSADDGTHYFEFLDGANLQEANGSHEHAFWIRVGSPDALMRSETYIANGASYDPQKDLGSTESFVRVK
jgi:hypothetical protein